MLICRHSGLHDCTKSCLQMTLKLQVGRTRKSGAAAQRRVHLCRTTSDFLQMLMQMPASSTLFRGILVVTIDSKASLQNTAKCRIATRTLEATASMRLGVKQKTQGAQSIEKSVLIAMIQASCTGCPQSGSKID